MTKVIDNFNVFTGDGSLLQFPDDDTFYTVQLIIRKKDHPDKPEMKSQQVIRTYFIDSPEKLSTIKSEIISLCRQSGARAYINPSPKSYKKMCFLMSKLLLERIEGSDFRKCYKVAESAAGQTGSKNGGWWVIDCDFPLPSKNDMQWWDDFNNLNAASNERRNDYQFIRIVSTPNGFHLLVRPFGPISTSEDGLKWSGGKIHCGEIKKNASTILYVEV